MRRTVFTILLLIMMPWALPTAGAATAAGATPGVRAAITGLPDSNLTPGAVNPNVTQVNIQQTICVRGYTKTIRPPERYTEALKHRQLRKYGYRDQKIWHYEEDHLVPLEVGGAPRDPRNLWPEPHYGKWGSYIKDALENELHWRVCHGRISLRVAQRVFETDWVAGYRKYVVGRHYNHYWRIFSPHRHFRYWR